MAISGTDTSARDQAVKVGNPIIYNMPTPASYAGSATYLPSDIVGGIIVHNTSGGAVTGTMPSPAALAALIEAPRIGDCVECLIINGGSAGNITLTAVAGVTFDTNQLAGSQIVATLTSKYITCRFTNVTPGSMAYVVYS
jgi:hypothetical protein